MSEIFISWSHLSISDYTPLNLACRHAAVRLNMIFSVLILSCCCCVSPPTSCHLPAFAHSPIHQISPHFIGLIGLSRVISHHHHHQCLDSAAGIKSLRADAFPSQSQRKSLSRGRSGKGVLTDSLSHISSDKADGKDTIVYTSFICLS